MIDAIGDIISLLICILSELGVNSLNGGVLTYKSHSKQLRPRISRDFFTCVIIPYVGLAECGEYTTFYK